MPKLTVKCSDAELVVWKESAWDARVSLSEWVRRALDRAANGVGVSEPVSAGRGLVAGVTEGGAGEAQRSPGKGRRQVAETPEAESQPEMASGERIVVGAPAASPCKREHLHHTNHGGKPCPECGWPND